MKKLKYKLITEAVEKSSWFNRNKTGLGIGGVAALGGGIAAATGAFDSHNDNINNINNDSLFAKPAKEIDNRSNFEKEHGVDVKPIVPKDLGSSVKPIVPKDLPKSNTNLPTVEDVLNSKSQNNFSRDDLNKDGYEDLIEWHAKYNKIDNYQDAAKDLMEYFQKNGAYSSLYPLPRTTLFSPIFDKVNHGYTKDISSLPKNNGFSSNFYSNTDEMKKLKDFINQQREFDFLNTYNFDGDNTNLNPLERYAAAYSIYDKNKAIKEFVTSDNDDINDYMRNERYDQFRTKLHTDFRNSLTHVEYQKFLNSLNDKQRENFERYLK